MSDDKERLVRVIHQVNNLLGVIGLQTVLARQSATESAARQALEIIEAAATKTERVTREVTGRVDDKQ